ncbi:hypothetical protein BH10PSE17_BH10PSE17_05530 [soil metagenome]
MSNPPDNFASTPAPGNAPRVVPLSAGDWHRADHRAPFEVTPPQLPFVQAVLDWLPLPVVYVDAERVVRFVNDAFAARVGVQRVQLLDQPVGNWARLGGDPLSRALEGSSQITEGLVLGALLQWLPQIDEQGQVRGCLVMARDLPRGAMRDLPISRGEPADANFDALPFAVARIDLLRQFTWFNRGFADLASDQRIDLLGRTPADWFEPSTWSQIEPYFDRAESGQTLEFDQRWHDHGERWHRVRLIPNTEGELQTGLMIVVSDVHDEKSARASIERREQQLRRFSDNVPQPLAYIDPHQRFGMVNRAFAAFLGVEQETVTGHAAPTVIGSSLWDQLQGGFARAAGNFTSVEEQLLVLPNGRARWTEVRWMPEQDPAGHESDRSTRGVYLLLLDIHEQRQVRTDFERSMTEMRRAMNSIGTPIAFIDADQRFRFVNASMQEWNSLPASAMIGHRIAAVVEAKLYEKFVPHIAEALAGRESVYERELTMPNGVKRWARLRCVPQRSDHGQVTGFYTVIYDVHDLKVQQRELQLKQEELRRANWLLSSHLENSPLAALELDADLNIRRWSERAERLFGWHRDTVLHRSLWELQLIADGEVDAITRSFALVLSAHQQRVSALQRVTRQDGAQIWCEWYISALADESGAITSIFALVHDVNQRVEAEARLQQLVALDALTNLPNRSKLQFELTQALDRARRTETGVAAMFIDLDHFKNVNDTLGHRVGDQLLVAVARILKTSVRKGDLVSRMGGDEFMVVIEHSKARVAAQHIADKILRALEDPIPVEGHMLTVAASIGIAVFPDHGTDANLLLKNSDVAMYHAKELGKGRFELYTEELAREREELALIEFSLRAAMTTNQLSLLYQPRVSIRDGSIEGAEALLRWKHPELGDIPPKKFIRVAEETGLIFELGTWVFRRACVQLREWELKRLPVQTLSVNFSARQLLMRDLIDRISGILTETGCDARHIEIEITETSMLFDVATIKRVVTSLKRLGLRIAIDDFGTGFSSLSHLQQLDLDTLKVDQSFVRDLLVDAGDAAITRAVISLGHGIGLKVVAEGVENLQQLAFLKECGCDLYQGFHFSPAIPGRAFEELMRLQVSAHRMRNQNN